MRQHPDMCLQLLQSTIDPETKLGEVIAIKWGETGYHGTDYEHQTEAWVDHMNERLLVSKLEAEAMEICSMGDTASSWKRYNKVLASLQKRN